jgi:hypothetical protein
MARSRARAILLAAAVASCGGSQPRAATADQAPFDCKERAASYVISGHISGDELGVQFDCDKGGPRIVRWKADKQGHRIEDAHALPPGEFEKLWAQVDGTGWRNLQDCPGTGQPASAPPKGKGKGKAPPPPQEPTEPVYQFDIKDDQGSASFSCQGRTMPYPYNDLVDPLDLAASQGRGQLGGDSP